MVDNYVQAPTDGAGKKLQTFSNVVGANTVHAEAVTPVDSAGTELVLATETTLATVHGHVDSIDGKITACNTGAVVVSSGNVTSNAQNIATETTLGTVHGHVDSIDGKMVSGTDIGDVTINNAVGAAAVNVQDGGNTLTVDGAVVVTGTLTQSTKHDAKVYAPAIFDAAASGNLVAAVANKVTKLHAIAVQAQGTVVVNLNNGVGGASLMEWSFQAREGAILSLASAPAYWAVTGVNTILYVTLSAAVQVTITAIISSDDVS